MYQHGKRVRRPHSAKVFLATLTIVGIVILVSWVIIHRDIGSLTTPKASVPIITDQESSTDATIDIQEPLFTMKLPKDWKLIEHQQESYKNAYIYVSTKEGADDRRLTVHVDIMPPSYKIVKMQPVIPDGDRLLLGNLSDNCINFAGDHQLSSNAPIQAKWENVTFMCDPITNNQTIGIGTAGEGIGVKLEGTKGPHKFFLYYEDYNIYPDHNILRNALESFRAL